LHGPRIEKRPKTWGAKKATKSKKSVFGFWQACKEGSGPGEEGLISRSEIKARSPRVFELPSLKNTRKRDKTKEVEEKLTSNFLSKFWGKFSTWTFCI
jgi:hypothetical protein